MTTEAERQAAEYRAWRGLKRALLALLAFLASLPAFGETPDQECRSVVDYTAAVARGAPEGVSTERMIR